jgi:hypothetical protein
MMGWSMSEGGIWVGSPPSEDRRTIDDEIACANQATTNGYEHREATVSCPSEPPCFFRSFVSPFFISTLYKEYTIWL